MEHFIIPINDKLLLWRSRVRMIQNTNIFDVSLDIQYTLREAASYTLIILFNVPIYTLINLSCVKFPN